MAAGQLKAEKVMLLERGELGLALALLGWWWESVRLRPLLVPSETLVSVRFLGNFTAWTAGTPPSSLVSLVPSTTYTPFWPPDLHLDGRVR